MAVKEIKELFGFTSRLFFTREVRPGVTLRIAPRDLVGASASADFFRLRINEIAIDICDKLINTPTYGWVVFS